MMRQHNNVVILINCYFCIESELSCVRLSERIFDRIYWSSSGNETKHMHDYKNNKMKNALLILVYDRFFYGAKIEYVYMFNACRADVETPRSSVTASPMPPIDDLAPAEEENQRDQKNGGSRERTRSVFQKKLTNLIVWMGRLGIGLAVLTVIVLYVRFIIDHFVLTNTPRVWNWVYLQFFIKYIVIGMVVVYIYMRVCWTDPV